MRFARERPVPLESRIGEVFAALGCLGMAAVSLAAAFLAVVRYWRGMLLAVSVPVVAFALLAAWFVWSGWRFDRRLRRAWEDAHGRGGRRILFVHSDSPVWREHVATEILPWLGPHAVLLNWSERSRWDEDDLRVRVFRRWKPERGFNPMALVLPEDGPVETISLWQPFRDWKHGRTHTLAAAERRLREAVERVA